MPHVEKFFASLLQLLYAPPYLDGALCLFWAGQGYQPDVVARAWLLRVVDREDGRKGSYGNPASFAKRITCGRSPLRFADGI